MDEAEYCHRLALMYRGKVIALGTPAELKKLAGQRINLLHLEVRTVLGSMNALEKMPGLSDVAVFGGGLHVTAVDAANADSARFGGAANRPAFTVRAGADPASMEDVFVAMIEEEERKAA